MSFDYFDYIMTETNMLHVIYYIQFTPIFNQYRSNNILYLSCFSG